MRGDVLSLPAEASRPDIILKVHTHTPTHKYLYNPVSCACTHKEEFYKNESFTCQKPGTEHTHTLLPNGTHTFVLQGNQMTLVFMEREYSSPEEPHLGIVHMVEVKSLVHAVMGSLSCTRSQEIYARS